MRGDLDALVDQYGQAVCTRLHLALADREALGAGPRHLRPLTGPRGSADSRAMPAEPRPSGCRLPARKARW